MPLSWVQTSRPFHSRPFRWLRRVANLPFVPSNGSPGSMHRCVLACRGLWTAVLLRWPKAASTGLGKTGMEERIGAGEVQATGGGQGPGGECDWTLPLRPHPNCPPASPPLPQAPQICTTYFDGAESSPTGVAGALLGVRGKRSPCASATFKPELGTAQASQPACSSSD